MLRAAVSAAVRMPAICASTCFVACAVRSASALTSVATTAKPRPASPTRAASTALFSASRFVWNEIELISFTTCPTCRVAPFELANRADRGFEFAAQLSAAVFGVLQTGVVAGHLVDGGVDGGRGAAEAALQAGRDDLPVELGPAGVIECRGALAHERVGQVQQLVDRPQQPRRRLITGGQFVDVQQSLLQVAPGGGLAHVGADPQPARRILPGLGSERLVRWQLRRLPSNSDAAGSTSTGRRNRTRLMTRLNIDIGCCFRQSLDGGTRNRSSPGHV